ncbi:NAD(P)H-dependent flavin oxidoreductase [Alicyclobacillus mengziensis]|uniref:NAD(P)H-dependent flavin oxidoreductase n=1 Tax=Alicyclobacillus mengziensis TaxID=2931921 RepID=UPI0020127800|nr:nitronate monooxygenase [Alicyclobacillus mengziensis]
MTEILHIEVPIIQAPMAGGATTPDLVAAVSNAGGLGCLGAGYMKPDDIQSAISHIRARTHRPFAVNLFIPGHVKQDAQSVAAMMDFLQVKSPAKDAVAEKPDNLVNTIDWLQDFEAQLAVVLAEKVPVFSFTFGCPSEEVLLRLHENGTIVMGTATTVEEAVFLERRGVDAVVAQGSEAGGHRGAFLVTEASHDDAHAALNQHPPFVGLMALLEQIAQAVQIPMVASGGIMNGRGIVASLALGASGVQLGTAFLTTDESGAHPKYKETLLNSTPNTTVVTRAFSGKWARGIRNDFIDLVDGYDGVIPDYPIQNTLTRTIRNWAAKTGRPEYMSLWSGEGGHLCRSMPASQLVAVLVEETEAALRTLG